MNTLEKLQAIKLGNQDFWKVYESFNASEHDISEADIPSLLEIVANQDLFDSKEEEDWLSHSLAIKSLRQFKSAAGFKLLIELAKKQEDPDFLTEEIFAFSKEFRYEGYGLLKAEFLAIEGKNDILGFLAGGIKESVKDSESIQKEEAAQV